MNDFIDIVFDGPPDREGGRFVEVEDAGGRSISVGGWVDRGDGLWALRIPRPGSEVSRLEDELAAERSRSGDALRERDGERSERLKYERIAAMNLNTVVAQQEGYNEALDRLRAAIQQLLNTAKSEGLITPKTRFNKIV